MWSAGEPAAEKRASSLSEPACEIHTLGRSAHLCSPRRYTWVRPVQSSPPDRPLPAPEQIGLPGIEGLAAALRLAPFGRRAEGERAVDGPASKRSSGAPAAMVPRIGTPGARVRWMPRATPCSQVRYPRRSSTASTWATCPVDAMRASWPISRTVGGRTCRRTYASIAPNTAARAAGQPDLHCSASPHSSFPRRSPTWWLRCLPLERTFYSIAGRPPCVNMSLQTSVA
jgi:hypothetical protein